MCVGPIPASNEVCDAGAKSHKTLECSSENQTLRCKTYNAPTTFAKILTRGRAC